MIKILPFLKKILSRRKPKLFSGGALQFEHLRGNYLKSGVVDRFEPTNERLSAADAKRLLKFRHAYPDRKGIKPIFYDYLEQYATETSQSHSAIQMDEVYRWLRRENPSKPVSEFVDIEVQRLLYDVTDVVTAEILEKVTQQAWRNLGHMGKVLRG